MFAQMPLLVALNRKLDPLYSRFDWIVTGLVMLILLLPKFQLIPVGGTYVNIRFEDFLVLVVYGIWFFGLLMGRYSIRHVFNSHVLLFFLGYGLLITLIGIQIMHSIQEPHLGFLHWLRRVEYFGMYFVATTVCKKENLVKYMYCLLIVGVLTWIYAFLQWNNLVPGVHTLNKPGEIGTYKEIGYLISTFAAHYDYGAFLILMMALSIWGYYSHTRWWQRILFVVMALSFWWMARLVYGRSAYLGMLVGAIFMFVVKKSAWIFAPIFEVWQTFDRYFGGKFSRYSYQFKFSILPEPPKPPASVIAPETVSNLVPNTYTNSDGVVMTIDPRSGAAVTPGVSPTPSFASTVAEQTETIRTGLDTIVHQWSLVLRGQLSRLNVTLDPSANIRLREWQDGMARLGYHFLWGRGYYSNGLGIDSDYVRHIIEVGVIGLSIFLLVIWDFMRVAWRAYRTETDAPTRNFHLAVLAFVIGLLIEAIFIDIFEASKIAFLLWFLFGIVALYAPKPAVRVE